MQLSKIPLSTIGKRVTVLPSLIDEITETTIALQAGNYVAAAEHGITAGLVCYCPALVVSASTVLGFTANLSFNIENAYNDGELQKYPLINDLIKSLLPFSQSDYR
ncbi:MAG: hypothetical protein AB7U29_19985 [Desulfobulbus sp.]